jgi:hypothetical protein
MRMPITGIDHVTLGAEFFKHSSEKVALLNAIALGRVCSMLEIAGLVDFFGV